MSSRNNKIVPKTEPENVERQGQVDLERGVQRPEQVAADAELNSSADKRRRSTLCYVVAFVSLLIGAAIGVGIVLAGKKSGLTLRQQELSDIVSSISDPAALADSASPQAKARHWLVFDDKLWVDKDEVVTREMAVQRYVLATFYFATSGPKSWVGNNWLQGHECDNSWTGIKCNASGQVRALALGKCFHIMTVWSMSCSELSTNLTNYVASRYTSRTPRTCWLDSI